MVTLIILDGFGLRKEKYGNAIAAAGTPNLDKLKKMYPYTTLEASGKFVGLPEGQMGNSEVGHLTLGAGRVILQDLERINEDIKTGTFYQNPRLIKAILHAKKYNSALHLIGLVSDGGVHSHINHLFALISLAKENGLEKVFIHAFMDGRDTLPNSGAKYISLLEEKLKGTPYKIASLSGRVYAMDREERYDRLQLAYDTLVNGANYKNLSALEALKESYRNGKFDEFVLPVLLEKEGTIKDKDSVIFFNFRSDRAIELTNALTNQKFDKFKVKKFKNLLFSPMELYHESFKSLNVIYPPEKIEDNLSAVISKHGLKQFHIAETTKYAHVTFFFNGTIEKPYKNEERKLIESIKSSQADGFIFLYSNVDDTIINYMYEEQRLFVLIGKATKMINDTIYVDNDNVQAAKEATEYLISLGHRKIAYIGTDSHRVFSSDRKAGYLLALSEHNLPYQEKYCLELSAEVEPEYENLKKLLTSAEKPTAILVCDDVLAVSIEKTIRQC